MKKIKEIKKVHKFWYSLSQNCVGRSFEEIEYDGASKHNYVKTKNGWEEYSEWCSSGGNSNWEDAVLVFETTAKPKIKIEYKHTSDFIELQKENERLGLLCDKLSKDYVDIDKQSKYHAKEMNIAQAEVMSLQTELNKQPKALKPLKLSESDFGELGYCVGDNIINKGLMKIELFIGSVNVLKLFWDNILLYSNTFVYPVDEGIVELNQKINQIATALTVNE